LREDGSGFVRMNQVTRLICSVIGKVIPAAVKVTGASATADTGPSAGAARRGR
jgi:hypothetical protein